MTPGELERELRDALLGAAPSAVTTARARDRVLTVCGSTARRPRRRLVVLAAAAALATAAVGAVATTSRYLGVTSARPPDPTFRIERATADHPVATLTRGVAAVTTRHGDGFRRRATAVELSPAGLFAAFGGPASLTVTELDGTVRWARAVDGTVIRVAWASYPTYIAYVTRDPRGTQLRVIWANGTHDRLVARDVVAGSVRWTDGAEAVAFRDRHGRDAVWERWTGRIRLRASA